MGPGRAIAGVGLALIAGGALAAPRPAEPAWTACQVVHGVLVVPARAAGLTGPFILDTATPVSVLDATQATLAGLEAGDANVDLRFAGRRWPTLRLSVAPLDARTFAMPTPITGVLGADLLDGWVLEVTPDPCRLRLSRRPAWRGRALAALPIERRDGVPYVMAGVSDGEHARRGPMRVATGADLAVRLGPDTARVEGATAAAKSPTAPLRAISLGGLLVENPTGAIADAASPGVLGEIGEPVWSRQGFSLDLGRGRLVLFQPPTKRTRRSGFGGSMDR